MKLIFKHRWLLPATLLALAASACAEGELTGTAPLESTGDLSAEMIAGYERYLDRAMSEAGESRGAYWQRDFSSPAPYEKSVAPNRERLRRILGAVDRRARPVRMEFVSGPDQPALVAEAERVQVFAVRWTVLEGVTAEGLLLEPRGAAVARIVALPDADQTPEDLAGRGKGREAFAKKLAEAGCQVLVPALIDRQCTWAGNPKIAMTDQAHREWIWRQAFEMGRHIVGFEIEKVEAAVDWLRSRDKAGEPPRPIGVAGYGEGGLIALGAAALDPRVQAALVSGYFQPREELWSEPIYRNVWSLLREFGDAEIASLVAPRSLVIEHSEGPLVECPPKADAARRKTAAPGALRPPAFAAVRAEVERARALSHGGDGREFGKIDFIAGDGGAPVEPGSDNACAALLAQLGVKANLAAGAGLKWLTETDPAARQQRQIAELESFCQQLLHRSEEARTELWKSAAPKSAGEWPQATEPLRQRLWNDVLGRLPDPTQPANPRARKLEERAAYTIWEVTLDVWPDVFAWGYLLVPRELKPGERRPVVVCQHGSGGRPASVIDEDEKSREWLYYRAYARRLAERGFIVFCPHNPYRNLPDFRQVQRKAHPLGLTFFSFIIGQHQRALGWLKSLPFVDAKRIGFYGLSYGGVSALRLPALLPDYSVSICSAAFNDWARKVVSNGFRSAYLFTGEHEMFSFDLAHTFSNAELAALIAPRPFMVERGHDDGVAPDEWVGHEYAKVRRLYARLGVPERTEIEFFNGGHSIHGEGTFDFLHRHLHWPKPPGAGGKAP